MNNILKMKLYSVGN